jgi:transposase
LAEKACFFSFLLNRGLHFLYSFAQPEVQPMKRKQKNKHKSIVFGEQPLVVFSNFVTHPVTGFTLEEISERVNFDFLNEYAPPRCPTGRPSLPFVAMCKAVLALFCERFPSQTELCRRLKREKRLQNFCGFQNGKTPSKQALSEFLIRFPEQTQQAIFSEFHRQLQRVEYVENQTASVDACVYRTVNKRKERLKIEKRNNETGRMKSVHGIKQVTTVLAQRGVCSGFFTDLDGHHDTVYYEEVMDQTLDNGYWCPFSTADKGFDSNELRWLTLLKYGMQAVIPKREYKKNKKAVESKKYRERRRNLSSFATEKEKKVYNDRTSVERYYAKMEGPLGLARLKTKRDESGASLLAFANMFDVICRTVHLYKTLENAMIPLTT